MWDSRGLPLDIGPGSPQKRFFVSDYDDEIILTTVQISQHLFQYNRANFVNLRNISGRLLPNVKYFFLSSFLRRENLLYCHKTVTLKEGSMGYPFKNNY
jgi:hypothetical protein